MDDNQSDPNIVNRLKRMPPYDDEPQPASPPTPEPEPKESVEEPKEEVTEDKALENSKNPERTKEYIDKLKKERDEARKNVVASLKPDPTPQTPTPSFVPQAPVPTTTQYPNLPQAKIDDIYSGLVDQEGYVDVNLLKQRLTDADARVRQAEERVKRAEDKAESAVRKVEDFEESREVRIVHKKFPTLDPNNEAFDETFYEAVRGDMVNQLIDTGKQDFMSAAAKWYDRLYPMNKKELKQKQEGDNARKQINATQPKTATQRAAYSEDHESLVQATRQGAKGALAERLKRSGY